MKSYKHTKATQLIKDLFLDTDQAMSVSSIIDIVRSEMNRTTVYRVLDRLKEQSVLHSFVGKDGLKWYARCFDNQKDQRNIAHPHFQCEVCGKSKCLHIGLAIPDLPDHKITGTNVLITGRCSNCIEELSTNK